MSTGKAYTKEQEIILQQIADSDKSSWSSGINAALPQMGGRKYGQVWQKVYALSGQMPDYNAKSKKKAKRLAQKEGKKKLPKKNTPEAKKARRPYGSSAPKIAIKSKPVKDSSYKRKLHKSPLRGTTMTATSNELRFPIESMRIEGGELIVTFK